jgi:hypothetical protein
VGKSVDECYGQWLKAIFDCPEGTDSYADRDTLEFWNNPELALGLIAKTFREVHFHVESYSRAQILSGLEYMNSVGGGCFLESLKDPNVSLAAKKEVVDSMLEMFKNYFVKQIDPLFWKEDDPAVRVCHMWWDQSSIHCEADKVLAELITRVLGLQSQIQHIAVQSSAIHGLGHWHKFYPELTTEALETLLRGGLYEKADECYVKEALAGEML